METESKGGGKLPPPFHLVFVRCDKCHLPISGQNGIIIYRGGILCVPCFHLVYGQPDARSAKRRESFW